MATSNFNKKNAKAYYVILDTYKDEDGNDVMRDDYDYKDYLDAIREVGKANGNFPVSDAGYGLDDMLYVCSSNENKEWERFGKSGKVYHTETTIEKIIGVRDGYYSGANLDFDLIIRTYNGDSFQLSDYYTREDLVNDYLDHIEYCVENFGLDYGWTLGTFKMQKENIRKWINKRIDKAMEECDDFCKDNCEGVYEVSARFSNGETWYSKVG